MRQPVKGLYDHLRRGIAAYLVLLLALVPTGIVYFRVRANVAAREQARFAEVVRLTQEKIQERITHHADEMILSERMIDGVLSADNSLMMAVEIFDGPETNSESLLYAGWRPPGAARPLFSQVVPISVLGRTWSLRFTTLPAFESASESDLPLIVLVGGLTFSLMLFRITRAQVDARASAERLNRSLLQSEEKLRETNRRLEVEIAGHRTADEKLAYERDLLRTMMDHCPDRIYFKDKESRFVKCGQAVVEGLAVAGPSFAIGKTDADFFNDEHARAAHEDEQRIIRTGEPIIGKVEKEMWKNGREAWVLTNKMPWRDERGNIIGTFGISKDITALKQAERDLAAEKELLTVTLRAIGDGVITTDTESRIVLFNMVAEQLTGWLQADAVGRPLSEVYRTLNEQTRETDTCLLRKTIATGIVVSENHPTLLITRDGDERNISETAAPILGYSGKTIGAVLIFRDISKRLKTEAERQKASKLESIGLLAGGIAHDFNNILTVILGNISLAQMGDGSVQSMRGALHEAEKASLRARELTRKLLTFARGGSPIKKPILLGALLQDWTQLALHGTGLTAEFAVAENLPPVEVDEGQISQVFHNLVRHARQSSIEGGKIEVCAAHRTLTEGGLLLLDAGSYVVVSIRDFGKGLGVEQISKIFDPYFSSKKLDTGLELATAYSIVRKHGGQIKVESTPGQGTTFHVYLPAATQPVAVPPPVISRKPATVAGRVLVMDDEPAIRKLSCHMLEKSGWKVGLARDGAEAIELYQVAKQEGNPFTAVILDLSVPNGMGGKECIRELKLLDPEVKAIVCSGYFNDPVMANYRDYGFCGVVPKPYGTQELVLALSEMLSTDSSSQTEFVRR